MKLDKKNKLVALSRKLGGEDYPEGQIFDEIIQKVDDLTQKVNSIQLIKGNDGKTPTKDEIVALIKPLIPEPIAGKDAGAPNFDEKFKEMHAELLSSIPHGGNANRNIVVEGQTVLTPYTDINFVGTTSSILTLTDFQAQQTKIIIPTGGGGGGTPGGSDTQVQFNDGGSFGGNSRFTYDKAASGSFNAQAQDGSSGAVGASISLFGGDSDDPNVGGDIQMNSGNGITDGRGGNYELIAGNGGDTSDGGLFALAAGNGGATSGSGGSISLTAGSAQGGDSNGGAIHLTAGNAIGGNVGAGVFMRSGNAGTGGHGAIFTLAGGDDTDDLTEFGGMSAGISGNKGGDVFVHGGNNIAGSGDADGGDVILYGGDLAGGGANGVVKLKNPTSGKFARLDTSLLSSSDKTFTFPDASGTLAAPTSVASAGQYLMTTGGGISQWASIVSGGGSGITRSVSKVSTSQTAGASSAIDYVFFAQAGVKLTLPTAVGNSNMYTVKNMTTSSVLVAAPEGIDDGATALISVQYQSLDLISNGSIYGVI